MKFEVHDRVRVPATNAQAVVMDATETVRGFPVYTLKYLNDAGDNECGTVGEGDLAAANRTTAELHAEAVAKNEADAAIERRVTALVAAGVRNALQARRRKAAPKRKR